MNVQLDEIPHNMYLWDDGSKKLRWQLQTSCSMYLNEKDVFLQMTLLINEPIN